MITGTCLICFSRNIKVYDIRNSHLKHAYERLTGFTVNSNYNVCCICCARLRLCYILTKQSNTQSENTQVTTHSNLSLVNIENATIPYHKTVKQEIDVKLERISDEDEIDVGVEDTLDIPNCLAGANKITKKSKLTKRQYKNEKQFDCPICEKSYKRPINLKQHMRTHSDNTTCGVCGLKLTLYANLKKHMATHSDEKPFSCEQCEKSFKRTDHLKLHTAVHSKIKSFTCNTCNMKFKRKSTLLNHKLVHLDDKPYVCDICSARFNKKGNMKVHIMGHASDKPYKCTACPKSYIKRSILRKHQEKYCPSIKAVR